MPPENPPWHYDDLRQVGLDFEDTAAAAAYDRNQGSSRVEDNALLDRLEVRADDIVIDLGAGTGAFAVEAAKRCRKVFAVDVSGAMLAFAGARATEAGVETIAFRRGGFLSYEHEGPLADFVITKYALHHLPDFWKAVALLRINRMLRVGGVLFLRDVIFSFPVADYRAGIDGWIARVAKPSGEGFTEADFAMHVREEHSTFSWIIEGMLTRAGFRIQQADCEDPAYGDYTCVKIDDAEPVGGRPLQVVSTRNLSPQDVVLPK